MEKWLSDDRDESSSHLILKRASSQDGKLRCFLQSYQGIQKFSRKDDCSSRKGVMGGDETFVNDGVSPARVRGEHVSPFQPHLSHTTQTQKDGKGRQFVKRKRIPATSYKFVWEVRYQLQNHSVGTTQQQTWLWELEGMIN